MIKKLGWQVWIWSGVLALVLALLIKSDLSELEWASRLSIEGSPPPKRDVNSPTGYALGQRHFLGTHERGESYRWIAATQELIASGPFAQPAYQADNVPLGRPRLMPKLYAIWLAAISRGLHIITGEPTTLSVEQAALWEPAVSHVMLFVSVIAFMWLRYGAVSAGLAGLFFASFPPISGQFLPGALTARTWALFLAAYAIALNLPRVDDRRKTSALGVRSAFAASLALWLDPEFGFPAVLISAAAGAGTIFTQTARLPWLKWSVIGSGVTLTVWAIDQNPWSPSAGELRYVHPLYALAWFGIGVGLDGWQNLRSATRHRKWHLVEIIAALPMLLALGYTQLKNGYKAWFYPSAAMRRLTSFDETTVFDTAIDWLAKASTAEIVIVTAPVLATTVALALELLHRHNCKSEPRSSGSVEAAVFAGVLALAFFRVRWSVIAALVALPILCELISKASLAYRRAISAAFAVFLFSLITWRTSPTSLQRSTNGMELGPADLDALIYRRFSHWMASHNPGQNVSVLAPPELSDSLVFHGGCRVLMSTAWESYPGHVAASRILSAPEATEAEAVLQSRAITHIVLPSWDKVLPLVVRKPKTRDRDTLYERLQRWVQPPYLRAIPYRLPPIQGYLDQKLAIFKVVPPQDEALSLSRVAEFFVEMARDEPAGLAANVLAQSFPEDPNAVIARAMVYAHANKQAEFDRELARLAADTTAGKSPSSWDRRVQRAIVLALGHRPELSRTEVEACIATASPSVIFDLTPLQAYRLHALATHFNIALSKELTEPLLSLGAEFASSPASPASP